MGPPLVTQLQPPLETLLQPPLETLLYPPLVTLLQLPLKPQQLDHKQFLYLLVCFCFVDYLRILTVKLIVLSRTTHQTFLILSSLVIIMVKYSSAFHKTCLSSFEFLA